MASTRTRAELISKILEKLGILTSGQDPEVEDVARVDDDLDSILSELPARDIVYVADPDAIEPAYFLSVATICAYELREQFGVSGDSLAALALDNNAAIGKLQVMTRARPTYEPLTFDRV